MVYDNIRRESELLAISPSASASCGCQQRLDEQIFLSQLNCRAVLLNSGFQSAVTSVVRKHLASGGQHERMEVLGHGLERLPSHDSKFQRLHSNISKFERLPSHASRQERQDTLRAATSRGWQTKQGDAVVSSDLLTLADRTGSNYDMCRMSMNDGY